MVRDLREELEHALGTQPPWRLGLDDLVTAAHRARRRRRIYRAAGSSAAVVLATGAVLVGPRLLADLQAPVEARRADPAGAAPPSASRPRAGSHPASTDAAQAARDRFFRAGYHYDDAVLLARLWGGHTSTDQAKVRAGSDLLAGRQLPVRPGQTAQTVSSDAAIDAFFDNGYGYDDAVRLAKVWRESTAGNGIGAVKVRAGRVILAGQRLPS